ncbi:hypothetical protein HPT27_05105 [Permianibacter sp. IMCC34836]|uniref:tetratricopeptide repeat protein n=1 Tax=Permianibacter fluminis TaxID=2738515 RepID=UPI001557B752|nr:hypothetical protein [Permianibacter fluminis]NQD36396.1 hypothetical protein [Permianibacter fluminis]
MTQIRRSAMVVAIAALLPIASDTYACGARFPNQLLDDRAATLSELPEGNFRYEMLRFGMPLPGLTTVTEATVSPNSYFWESDDDGESVPEQARLRSEYEQQELPSEQWIIVKKMRSMTDAQSAEAVGESLSRELRWYTAGAVAVAVDDRVLAKSYFERVLSLPPAERKSRTSWTQYSLGVLLASRQEWAAAKAMFAELRAAVASGNADPLELAVASLGEEARIAMAEGEWPTAVRLYSSQLAHGSESGYASLLRLAESMLALPDAELEAAMNDGSVQQFLAAYLFSRGAYDHRNYARVAKIFARTNVVELSSLDRLAAASYQYGDYDSARRFLEKAGDSGLAWWLRAKLALRSGDKALAQSAYAQAMKSFPKEEVWGEKVTENGEYESVMPQCRVKAEAAILSLGRGDYLDALDLLMQGAELYWLDAATLAERVLTVDELKSFVEKHTVPTPASKAQEGSHLWGAQDYHQLLRELLARRLMRAERYDEAVLFYGSPELRELATRYGLARKQAKSRWTATGRASAAYEAATLLRQSGMELIGFEMAPDFSAAGGMSEWAETKELDEWRTPTELSRLEESRARPNKRFHYRYVAAALANEAADQLSPRSQAFAATLCHATEWLIYRDGDAAQKIYQRYINEGPYVPWAAHFGQLCPEPDFQAAQTLQWQETVSAARLKLRPFKWLLAAGSFGLLALASMLMWRRRKRSSEG